MTESSTAYFVSFVCSHENVTSLKMRLTGIKPQSYEPYIFTPEFSIMLIVIVFAIVVSVVVYRQKKRARVKESCQEVRGVGFEPTNAYATRS